MKITTLTLLTLVLSMAMVGPALAYVGPGAGLSVLGALWALLLAVLSALAYIILWPWRRMRRRKRQAREAQQAREQPADAKATTVERRDETEVDETSSSGSRLP